MFIGLSPGRRQQGALLCGGKARLVRMIITNIRDDDNKETAFVVRSGAGRSPGLGSLPHENVQPVFCRTTRCGKGPYRQKPRDGPAKSLLQQRFSERVGRLQLDRMVLCRKAAERLGLTFKLKINEAEEGIRILDAEFVQTSTGNTYKALDSSYESRKLDNIIGRNLAEVDDSMALFFEVYEEGGSHDYTGTLRLSFSGSEGWKEFSTELR